MDPTISHGPAADGPWSGPPGLRIGRIAELDGLRGLAVILVVVSHANVPVVRYGGLVGVSLFFVLSGYLITSLLVAEQRATGHVAIRAFYVRRALRLIPALAVALLGGTALAAASGAPLRPIAGEALDLRE